MKKLSALFLSLLLALSLVACSDNAVNPVPTVQPDPETPPTNITSEVIDLGDLGYESVMDITAREVVDDYLAGTGLLSAFYDVGEGGENWLRLKVPGSSVSQINLDYLYPSATWTPEEIAASYQDGTVAWLNLPWKGGKEYLCLWSQDCEYEFVIHDGWLHVNGYRSVPVACRTMPSIDPMDLLAAYQAGEWDGETVWSEDYGTMVYMYRQANQLHYEYQNPAREAQGKYNPGAAYAYADAAAEPWWRSDDHGYDVFISSYTQYSDGTHNNERIDVKDIYLDLPGGRIESSVTGEVVSHWGVNSHDDDATMVVTTEGVWMFSRGVEIDHWSAQVDATDGYLHDPYWNDDAALYLYTGSQFIKLEDGGRLNVRVAQTAGFTTSYESYSGAFFIEDGALKCLDVWSNKEEVRTVIASHITAGTGFRTIFVAQDDGYSYMLQESHDKPAGLVQLGDGTVDYYDELYRAWHGSSKDFIRCCQNNDLVSLAAGELIAS